MKNDKYLVDRKFKTLFYDVLSFTDISQRSIDDDDSYLEGRMARASIQISSLLPEIVANCLIETLSLPKSVFKTIDKLDPLSKMDYFLWSRGHKTTDKGCKEVQAISELQKIRNFMVHPKAIKTEWKDFNDFQRIAEFQKTQHLKISYSSDEWEHDDAVIVLSATMQFFDYLFRTLCKFSVQEVLHLLFNDRESLDNENITYSIGPDWEEYQKKWSLDMRFLGIDLVDEKHI